LETQKGMKQFQSNRRAVPTATTMPPLLWHFKVEKATMHSKVAAILAQYCRIASKILLNHIIWLILHDKSFRISNDLLWEDFFDTLSPHCVLKRINLQGTRSRSLLIP
jgi:hypothetical protein